jgi:hypothetical protein
MALPHEFDPGYGFEPFRTICADYPGLDVYPNADFRTEWGPIFHRGRLDGSSRVLIIGQDPAAHETFVRRILVGTAGKRLQGFLAKLGITTSYTLINTFLYSVSSQGGGNKHATDASIAEYRNRWIDAILSTAHIEAVVALGGLAEKAWKQWKTSPAAAGHPNSPFVRITHPTAPDSASAHDPSKLPAATKDLLDNWNAGLQKIRPAIVTPDVPNLPLKLYGASWKDSDLVQIPDRDFPAGLPSWMHTLDGWAGRGVPNDVPTVHRRVLTIVVPEGATS